MLHNLMLKIIYFNTKFSYDAIYDGFENIQVTKYFIIKYIVSVWRIRAVVFYHCSHTTSKSVFWEELEFLVFF